MDFRFHNTDLAPKGVIVLLVGEKNDLMAFGKTLNTALKGALAKTLEKQKRFTGKDGQVLVVNGFMHPQIDQIVLLGVGDAKELDEGDAQRLGAVVSNQLNGMGIAKAQIFVQDIEKKSKTQNIGAEMALGAQLRSYRFDVYKTTLKAEQKNSLTTLDFAVEDKAATQKQWKALSGLSDGIYLARDIVTEPPNHMYAEKFVERVRKSMKGLPVKIKVLTQAQMEKLGMGALLSVNHGTTRAPYTLIIEYNGLKNKKSFDLALVGKGVTFDTGGVSIKPALNMWDMKNDLAGGAAVVGAMQALAHRGAKANVVGLVGLVENVISDKATLPSDIVTSMSGQTIEVLNTDAEGRLVLADVLWYAQQTYKPQIMLNIATLTGAILMALADKYAGLFTEDDDLVTALRDAGEETGDRVWHMPMDATLDRQIDSLVADVMNISLTGGAGASTGAIFLKRFVKKETRWAHVDMAGMAWTKGAMPMSPAGATGYGVRLFDQFVRTTLEKNETAKKTVKKKTTAKAASKSAPKAGKK